jgi:hypothetical protein
MRPGRRGDTKMRKLTLFACVLVLSFATIATMRTESRRESSDQVVATPRMPLIAMVFT